MPDQIVGKKRYRLGLGFPDLMLEENHEGERKVGERRRDRRFSGAEDIIKNINKKSKKTQKANISQHKISKKSRTQ